MNFYEMPIGPLASRGTALDYHQIHIDVAGDLNRQRVVDVRDFGISSRSAYAGVAAPYYRSFPSALKQVFAREFVGEKLVRVNELLRPYGVEVLALDGYRPIELQWDLWNHFIEKGREALTNPTPDDLVKFAGIYCSDPRGFKKDDFTTWPVHNTGGAIDLTLRRLADGQELFMGSVFDDADGISATRYFENETLTSQSAFEARRNRRLLYHAMLAAGFANYAHEWWHYDLGTQMWVMNGGHKCCAYYGRTEMPEPQADW